MEWRHYCATCYRVGSLSIDSGLTVPDLVGYVRGGGDGVGIEMSRTGPPAVTQEDLDHQADDEGRGQKVERSYEARTQSGVEGEPDIMDVIKTQHDLAKAVKADDAMVPIHLWNDWICRGETTEVAARALEILRGFWMRVYRRRLCRDCRRFMVKKHGAGWMSSERASTDVAAVREILWRAANNEWFEYPFWSRLHFFRFPLKYQALARDGVPNFFISPGPTQKRPQPARAEGAAEVLESKLLKMIQRRYVVQPTSKLASLIK